MTLDERGVYDICPICFWEDEGITVLDEHSGANGVTLREGRSNYLVYGACSYDMVRHVKLPTDEQRAERKTWRGDGPF